MQLILIAFCFGAFLEGTGGGGAPVAIAGSFLIGLGFEPFQAATLCLVANTAPVAWGGVGNPIRVLSGVTGFPEPALSAMTGRILPPVSAILPLWLVRSMVGWRETWEVWPALVVSGLSFALLQFYWSNYQESGLVDIIAALVSLLAMVAFLKVWKPKTKMTARRGTQASPRPAAGGRNESRDDSRRQAPALHGHGAEGLVSLPAGVGLHLRLGNACRRPGASAPGRFEQPCLTCTGRSCGCRRSSPSQRPKTPSPT